LGEFSQEFSLGSFMKIILVDQTFGDTLYHGEKLCRGY
jgi:hypothetical protein